VEAAGAQDLDDGRAEEGVLDGRHGGRVLEWWLSGGEAGRGGGKEAVTVATWWRAEVRSEPVGAWQAHGPGIESTWTGKGDFRA
jgi:hypothetical protein